MNPTGVILSVFGVLAYAILLGIAISADCGCDHTQKQNHTVISKHKHKHKQQVQEDENSQQVEQQQYHGPHLSVLPIGPKLFGPFHLGF